MSLPLALLGSQGLIQTLPDTIKESALPSGMAEGSQFCSCATSLCWLDLSLGHSCHTTSLSLPEVALEGEGDAPQPHGEEMRGGLPPRAGAAPWDRPELGDCGRAMWAVGILGWLLLPVPQVTGARPCNPKDFGHGSVVCVCNATYCDTLDPLVLPGPGSYVKYESSKAGKRLERSEGRFQSSLRTPGLLLTINISTLYQHVKGFGGSLSDAAAMNILKLSQPAQDNLLRSYFSESGIEYNLVRVPMACSDFSVRPYSYDEVPDDYELKHFSLADEDVKMKIPLLRRALAMSKRPLLLFASPWTAPGWMRTNGDVRGKGSLKGKAGDKYHKAWANYFIKFLDEYAKHKVTFWAVTAQNEPLAGLFTPPQAPTIAFTAAQQRDFIAQDLGPALARSPHRTQLLMLDDQRIHLPHWAKVVLGNATAARYVAGLAVHWYLDAIVPPGCSLEATHKLFPEHFLLYTEACTGFFMFRFAVSLGCWERGDHYSYSILTVMNHFVSGWTDWNLALDLQGGPNWVKNFVDSPVIVDGSKDVFYKQPMFYHMGHFRFGRDVPLGIQDPAMGFIETVAPAHSIQTYLWRQQ
ncbi:lysosomal acid glucosylceramidase-like isoform X2 [Prinia subflava]|uniref:lysosomal acid glucosylceramidase-like isoform X2 n=1 Tax=Prinia subflava TaxID=208062 RepID=UPI002FDFBB57